MAHGERRPSHAWEVIAHVVAFALAAAIVRYVATAALGLVGVVIGATLVAGAAAVSLYATVGLSTKGSCLLAPLPVIAAEWVLATFTMIAFMFVNIPEEEIAKLRDAFSGRGFPLGLTNESSMRLLAVGGKVMVTMLFTPVLYGAGLIGAWLALKLWKSRSAPAVV
jgi:hypothetical protein